MRTLTIYSLSNHQSGPCIIDTKILNRGRAERSILNTPENKERCWSREKSSKNQVIERKHRVKYDVNTKEES